MYQEADEFESAQPGVFEQMQTQLSKAEQLQLMDLLKRYIAGLNVIE